MVISNTSPIINLACIGHLDLLPQLYGTVVIPTAVFHEITSASPHAPGAAEIRTADWICRHTVVNRALVTALKLELDSGESEVIACALEYQAQLLLMDERRGRKIAQRFGLTFMGLLGVLVLAKRQKLITRVQPLLNKLRHDAGFWISDALYVRVLQEVAEIK